MELRYRGVPVRGWNITTSQFGYTSRTGGQGNNKTTPPGVWHLQTCSRYTAYVTLNAPPSNFAQFTYVFSRRFIFKSSPIRQVDQTNIL